MKRLDGRRIVVTRPASKSDALGSRFEALGARVLRVPSIEITDVEADDASDSLLRRLSSYDWVVFTSASGVDAGIRRLDGLGVPRADFGAVRVAAVGPATARRLSVHGIEAAAVPARHIGVEVAGVVGPAAGRRFLLVRGDLASPALPAALRAAGGSVDEATVYRTMPGGAQAGSLRDGFDVVTFTSPSTVRSFVASLDEGAAEAMAGASVVTIGPVTTEAAREAGLAVAAEADPHTIDGLIAAVLALASAGPGSGTT